MIFNVKPSQVLALKQKNRIHKVEKKNGDKRYGLTADEKYLLVCEYGTGGSDPQILRRIK